MSVNTKTLQGRRRVRYESFDDLIGDAERLANGVTTIGNWSFGQILAHLAAALNSSIDGYGFSAPLPLRIAARLFMKKKALHEQIPAGFQIPNNVNGRFDPPDVSVSEGLERLRAAVERLKSEDTRMKHPVLGALSREESDKFQLRHAELHMSFARHPADDVSP